MKTERGSGLDHRPRRSSFSVAAAAGAAAVPARATRAAAMRASRRGLLGLGRRRKSDREAPPEGKARGRKTPPNGEVALPGRRRRGRDAGVGTREGGAGRVAAVGRNQSAGEKKDRSEREKKEKERTAWNRTAGTAGDARRQARGGALALKPR